MRRIRLLTAVAGLGLLGMAAPAPAPEPGVVVVVRPAAPSERPHRVYHAGPGRCVGHCAGPRWHVPVWVDVDLPPRRHPGDRRRPDLPHRSR